ncbi:uncharacterized protein HHUB_1217 [Halobacterium hubeiense]|uniref:Uncharacterized protein n=1 Tax=Halobacterium hubeiense TaxID=1407499 RepID=A0A0U5GYF0_9EURY|nr:uncharacterized protein HHUB_1217 [Halobacterium hubeiense]
MQAGGLNREDDVFPPRSVVQNHAVWGFSSRRSRVVETSSTTVFSLESTRRPRLSALSGHPTKRDGNDTTQTHTGRRALHSDCTEPAHRAIRTLQQNVFVH